MSSFSFPLILCESHVRGGDMLPDVLEGFSQVAGPAHAAAGQGDHGDQQGGDRGACAGGGGLGVGGLPGGRGAGRGRGRRGGGGHQGGEGASFINLVHALARMNL